MRLFGRRPPRSGKSLVEQILSDLERCPKSREAIYENVEEINKEFGRWYPPIKSLLIGGEAKFSGKGRLSILEGEASRSTTGTATIELEPMHQVFLIEERARQEGELVDLGLETRKRLLYTFEGDGQIFWPSVTVTESSAIGLGAESAAALEKERERKSAEARASRAREEHVEGKVVWVAAGGRYAAMMSMKSVNRGALERFNSPPFGILGVHEPKNVGEVMLLRPLAVWHDRAGRGEA